MSSEPLHNNPNDRPTPSQSLESRSGISLKSLSQGILILGSMMLFIWYFLTPDQRQTFLEYLPVPLGVVQEALLTLMVIALTALVCPACKLSKRNKTLQKFLEVEIEKRRRAEKELARAQEITQTGTWVLEVSDQRMQWSREMCWILDCGSRNAEMNPQRFLKSVHPIDSKLVQKEIQQELDKRVREKTLDLSQLNTKLQEKIDKQQTAIDRLEGRVDKAKPDWKPAP